MNIATWAIVAAILAVSALAINEALDRQEVGECQKWATQAREYPGFFLATWQSEQCVHHGIRVDAPVRQP